MFVRLFNAFTKITAWPIQKLCFRTKIYYEDRNVQNRTIHGSAIIISNHTSVYDYAVIMFVFFARTLRCQVAEVIFKRKGLGTLVKLLGAIKVDRNTYDFSFVESSAQILRRGGIVEIFPESRIPRPEESRPLPFKPSAAYLALYSGVPVIPIYTNGSYFSKKRACVIIGTPIYPLEHCREDLSDKENIALINEMFRNKIILLEEKLYEQITNK